MTGGPLAEDDVRAHLHAVLEEIDPSLRPFAELRRAVTRRRHRRQATALAAVGILIGAGITIGLTATGSDTAGRSDKIVPATPVDPAPALHNYVVAHGGTSPTAVLPGPHGGTYAADVEAGKVNVLSFDGQRWSSVAAFGSPLSGPPVVAVHRGPDGAGDAVAFQVDEAGADAVFNGIIVSDGGQWRYADFDCGTTHEACAGPPGKTTKYSYDATEVDNVLHTEMKSCTPSCVAGARYDVTWQWDSTRGLFVVQSSVKMP